ncbi:fungal-specific transcription factor domain-containing protein [Mycena rosella]|uniref:Fungal-specific transcription factor domain-containing protein n=1 Tax=Mycena rosella TaxID=1033263 RepID=A0AAD7DBR6_MYCRO|nr:fungal-specific transcription factor domain-containing protein [Mycena rosella]
MSSNNKEAPAPAKKRRVQRACDTCRIKRSNGLRMAAKKCTNCVENSVDCTFSGAVTDKRSHVSVLEARLELAEQLLRKERIIIRHFGGSADSTTPERSQWSNNSPILKHKAATSAATTPGAGVELAALAIRSMNTPAPPPQEGDLAHIALSQDLSRLSINHHSGAALVKAAVQLRRGYEEKELPWSSRRMKYWTFNPTDHQIPHTGPYVFPDADLLAVLVDHYFSNHNLYLPLLHRPTFERSLAHGLHVRDASFGAIVLLVCAIGSRFSRDPRVCGPEDEPLRCGWKYFDQLPHIVNHLFIHPTLYHLQYYCLAVTFLEWSAPTPCWTLIGIGIRIRKIVEVGAHRANNLSGSPTVETELWKRAFWVIICYDRIFSNALGRPCTTQYEDFDVELPIECDDEFWESEDPVQAFKQPAGKPSRITSFNCFIRLNNILAISLKILFSLNKAKSVLAVRDDAWEEHIVAELDSALNGWVDSIPSHLRWDPNQPDDNFFDQSAHLYCTYYQVQLSIHRPFIPMIRKDAPYPHWQSVAARWCSHVSEISRHRKDGTPVPVLVGPQFISGLVLLLNVWSGKRTGLPPHMNSAISEVQKCMACLRVCEKRWQSMGLGLDLLSELAAIGELPLLNPPHPPPSTTQTRLNKRARGNSIADRFPPYTDAASRPPLTFDAPPRQLAALPTSTTELGRLPVFHPYVERSSWYPTQTSTAPLGFPDFVAAGNTQADSSSVRGAAKAAGAGDPHQHFAPEAAMSRNTMALWANAPTGFEVDDWETYFNIISELNQPLGTAGAET